jgi:hypothetical protein
MPTTSWLSSATRFICRSPIWAQRALRAYHKIADNVGWGPGGVEASYDFQGAKNTAANAMVTVTVTLVNDVASY